MTPKITKLYEGLFLAKEKIVATLDTDPHVFIFVAGWSATGKTSQVAKKLQNYLPGNPLILSMDNYFRWQKYYEEHHITFDEPAAVNIDLFVEHLDLLKNWKSVMIPDFDFVNFCPIPEAIKVDPTQIIIIEWLFALDSRFKELTDLNIYVETEVNGRLIRRVLRDVSRTKQKISDIVDLFVGQVNTMHEEYVDPQKKYADILIHNEFIPTLEQRNVDIPTYLNTHNIPKL